MMLLRITVLVFFALEVVCSCKDYLVSGPNGIPDNQITASSQYDQGFVPAFARLNARTNWCPTVSDAPNSYIQATFSNPKKVIGIITQGRNDYDQWVTTYMLQYSFDGSYFANVLNPDGSPKVFEGNWDRNTQKIHILNYPIEMRVLRIKVQTYQNLPCLRFDVLGCDIISTRSCTDYLVSGPGGIMDSKMTASSQWNIHHAPALARLDYGGNNWCPSGNDITSPFIQVEFNGLKNVVGVVTQGRSNLIDWVQQYTVKYSYDGQNWVTIVNNYQTEKVFDGNVDQNTRKINNFERPVITKFLRVYPKSYHGSPCMRLDVIGCAVYGFKQCAEFLLTGPNAVSDDRLSANSYYNANHQPMYARLFSTSGQNWCPYYLSGQEYYIQANFNSLMEIVGVVTQGRHNADNWVTSYTVQYSFDGGYFAAVSHVDGNEKLFDGNSNRNTPTMNIFNNPIPMAILRITVKGSHGYPCLRFDVLGCDTTNWRSCSEYLVSGPRGVADDKLTESSVLDKTSKSQNSRLYKTSGYGGWAPSSSDGNSYIQVEFNGLNNVTAITTQGRAHNAEWVSQYAVRYSLDAANWKYVEENGNEKLFIGNFDSNTTIINYLEKIIQAKYLRIYPKTSYSHSALRFDVLGCPIVAKRQRFYGEMVPLNIDDTIMNSSIWNETKTADLDECVLRCYKDEDCLSFSFDENQQKCNGYGALFYRNDAFESNKMRFLETAKNVYYFDRSLVDHFGYIVLEDIGLCYKIHTSLKSQNEAKAYCKSESARLVPIATKKQLQALQIVLANNVILGNSNQLRVDGEYHDNDSSWRLFNNQEIRNGMWSSSGKDPTRGKCVVMTKDGLKSGNCIELMFFICGL